MKFPRICLYIFFATTLLIGTAACGQATATPTALPTADSTPAATVVPATLQPVDSERTLTVNGLERTYLIHVPPGLATDQPVPLVFVFHGLGEGANLIQQASGLNEISDTNGFIVVYPNGSGPSSALSWNAGGCRGLVSYYD